ncbi:glycosyltransferase family 2 protein [Candidatus Thiodictyon syntrophicum]|jgi:hypothetical protein|nr:glycosyltransferase [Candidatus Thiodictyon syntrophicum]
MPLISIVTPCYNAERYIQDTIDSVFAQTEGNWEWIITDDRSTDRSVEIISAISDSRVKLITSKMHRGAAASYNTCLTTARGRFVTFIDSDDLWEPEFLRVMSRFLLEKREEAAYCGYRRTDQYLAPLLSDFRATRDVTFRSLLYTNPLSTLSTMYDARRIGKVYFPYDNKREDHAMWLTLMRQVAVCRPVDRVLATYRIHPGSLSRNKWEMLGCQYALYRFFLGFNYLSAAYYTAAWAANGVLKYAR